MFTILRLYRKDVLAIAAAATSAAARAALRPEAFARRDGACDQARLLGVWPCVEFARGGIGAGTGPAILSMFPCLASPFALPPSLNLTRSLLQSLSFPSALSVSLFRSLPL
eukprot:3789970-Pleurochrysis_carterae.AAC.1